MPRCPTAKPSCTPFPSCPPRWRASASASPLLDRPGPQPARGPAQEEVRRRDRIVASTTSRGPLPVRLAGALPTSRSSPGQPRASPTTARSAGGCCTTPSRGWCALGTCPRLNMWVRTAPRTRALSAGGSSPPAAVATRRLEIGTGVQPERAGARGRGPSGARPSVSVPPRRAPIARRSLFRRRPPQEPRPTGRWARC